MNDRKQPHPIDVHVGNRLRLRRKLSDWSQTKLADTVGLTFQQIQKYERGANRMGASRLYDFAQALDVPVSFFFDDMPPEIPGEAPPPVDTPADHMQKREVLDLIRAYYAIEDRTARRSLFEVVKALARSDEVSFTDAAD